MSCHESPTTVPSILSRRTSSHDRKSSQNQLKLTTKQKKLAGAMVRLGTVCHFYFKAHTFRRSTMIIVYNLIWSQILCILLISSLAGKSERKFKNGFYFLGEVALWSLARSVKVYSLFNWGASWWWWRCRFGEPRSLSFYVNFCVFVSEKKS